MIHVDRPLDGPEVPASLVGDDCAGKRELDRALEYLEENGNLDGFTFKVYKSEDVKKALLGLFHNKCAYCEVTLARQPIDVEHYRPKGGYYDGAPPALRQPGYYWLAADWTNLLPSCIDCNRGRNQETVGGEVRRMGKENHFPLEDPSRRARRPGDETEESPLLLDPSRDQPERHLEFPPDGEGVVRATLDAAGREDPRGAETIRILGLDAVLLIQDRKLWWKEIQKQILDIDEAFEDYRLAPDEAARARVRERIRRLRRELEEYVAPDRPYSGMARQIVKAFVERANWP